MSTIINDKTWTLFLDRDGVINKRIPGKYISEIKDFCFLDGVKESLSSWSGIFKRIIIVTNQQGIGKGLMTRQSLEKVHAFMVSEFKNVDVHIDQVYYCTALAEENNPCRKPNIGMGLQAKADYPDINFIKSIMIGDSISDIEFASTLGMKKILVLGKTEESHQLSSLETDLRIKSMLELNFNDVSHLGM